MRVWIASFVLLFGIAELYQWFEEITLPLPVYILGGVFLAIASNYKKYAGWSFQRQSIKAELEQVSVPPVKLPVGSANWSRLKQYTSNAAPQLLRPISFTIRQTEDEN
ncbi:MAG: hypothetical protein KME06_22340 [Kastovskya adunca ATA6-11-RM4]|jgi:hypothetical protein|nr:hypothetical protein [Kastovskya adunca ATA6-11-RM4]